MTEPLRPSPAAVGGPGAATVARNALFLILGQAASTALGIVFSAALGRSLGASDFGIYYLVTTMATFAYVFVEWGQPLFVIREAARSPRRTGELLGTALALRVAFAMMVTAPVGLVAWALGYGARTTWLAVGMVLATLPFFLAQGYGMVFRALDRMGRDAVVSVSNKAATLFFALPVLAWGAGIPGIVAVQALAGVAALGVAVALHRRLAAPPLGVSMRAARELMAAGAPILAMTAAVSVQPYLDAIVLSKLAPASVVGWFGAARNILGTLMAPAIILGAAAYPQIARASGDGEALRGEVRSAFRTMLWMGALGATGTYLFARLAVGLIYGARAFGPAAVVLEVFAPGLLLLFVDILFGNVIYASGSGTTGFAIGKVVSVVVGTALDIALIPVFQDRFGNGGIGVMVAFALSEFVVFAAAVMVIRRGTLQPAIALDGVRAVAAAGATIALFRLMPGLPPWVAIPACVAIFTLASVAVGLVHGRDVARLGALLRPRWMEPARVTGSHP